MATGVAGTIGVRRWTTGVLALCALIVLAPTASACHASPIPALGEWDSAGFLYAAGTDDSTRALVKEKPAAAQYRVGEPSSGLALSSQAMQNGPRTKIEFQLATGFAEAMYFNVSRPIVGQLYWSTSAADASGSKGDSVRLRIELLSGSVLLGGDECTRLPTAAPKWDPMPMHFRAEGRMLEPGQPITLRITRIAGLSDLLIGTGGDRATYLEFRYTTVDPLSNTLYVKNNRVEFLGGGATTEPDSGQQRVDSSAAPLTLLVPLLAFGMRRRPAAAAAVLLLLTAVTAGCVGEKPPGGPADAPDDGSSGPPPLLEKRTEDESLREAGHGAVEGVVQDDVGLPLGGAHVAILGTNLFSTTEKVGSFVFPNVTAGRYVLRVDRSGFQPHESPFEVEVGKRTQLTVTMARPANQTGGFKPHIHDDWEGSSTKELWNFAFEPVWGTGHPQAGYPGYCPSTTACQARVPIDVNHPVPAGAVLIEVKLQWAVTAGTNELALRILTAADKTKLVPPATDHFFVPRKPGEVFRMAFFPNEADPAHQRFTNWEFWVKLPQAGNAVTTQPLVTKIPSIQFQVIAHKGVIPIEPEHPDFWKGRDSIVLMNGWKRGPGTGNALLGPDYPTFVGSTQSGNNAQFNTAIVWVPAVTDFVPPETKELRGWFSWSGSTSLAPATNWILLYKAADTPDTGLHGWTAYARTMPKGPQTGNNFTFSLKFDTPETRLQTDQFYQKATYWRFTIDDGMDPLVPAGATNTPNSSQGTIWSLYVEAVRDPASSE